MQTKWEEINSIMNQASLDLYGQPLDPSINDVAVGINVLLGGFCTRMSCEGHLETTPAPWVTIDFTNASTPTLRSAEQFHDLIGEYNRDRKQKADVVLGLYPIVRGTNVLGYELTTAVGRQLAEVSDETGGYESSVLRAQASLDLQQQEMLDFAALMKDAYHSGVRL